MRKKISVLCMVSGLLLLAAAISLAVYNYVEESRAEKAAGAILAEMQQSMDEQGASGQATADEMTVVEIDGYGYIGYLKIPALELELPVMSTWDYDRLKIAPCLYYGSVKTNRMVIAAHNYTRHFGKLSKLKIGDTVQFIDMDGRVSTYQVGDMEWLPPTATEAMIESEWDLTLYTCTYDGASRVTVRCERVNGQ